MEFKTVSREDVIKYIEVLRLAFNDKAFPVPTESGYGAFIELWQRILQPYEKGLVDLAMERVIKTSEFAPKIATVIKAIEELQGVNDKDENELWEELENTFYEVADNASRYHYELSGEKAKARNREIYESLSPEIKGFVRNVGQLIDIATADEVGVSVARSRFLKALPAIRTKNELKKEMQADLIQISSGTLKSLN